LIKASLVRGFSIYLQLVICGFLRPKPMLKTLKLFLKKRVFFWFLEFWKLFS
jgi:hypothetical protein